MDDLYMEMLYEAETTPEERAADALAAAEARAERLKAVAEEAEQRRNREQGWAKKHPREWSEWLRVQGLCIDLTIDFFGPDRKPYDFDDFLEEFGPAPSPRHALRLQDEALPFEKCNLEWAEPGGARSDEPALSPRCQDHLRRRDLLTIDEVMALSGRSYHHVYRAACSGKLELVDTANDRPDGSPSRRRSISITRASYERWANPRQDTPSTRSRRGSGAAVSVSPPSSVGSGKGRGVPPPSRHFKR